MQPSPLKLAALLLAALACLVYLPGLPGSFAFDDYHAIVANSTLAITHFDLGQLLDAALSQATGPFRRPLAMLSFAANRSINGLDPLGYKLVNIAIHALNALLVFALLRHFTPRLAGPDTAHSDSLAWFAAALWAVHPLNLSAVLYVVQRMTLLSTTLMLVALLVYASLRSRALAGHGEAGGRLVLMCACGGAALLVKETALLLPVYLFVIEALVFRFRASGALRRTWFLALVAGGLAVVLLLCFAPHLVFGGYAGRDFTPLERLLTEARVLMLYLHMLVLPQPHLFGLYHDDIALSHGLFQPPTTVLALIGVGALVAATGLRRWPYAAFGCAWFLGGHLLESTVYPLEIAHEHRNYLPAVGPLLALVLGAHAALARRARWRAPLAALVLVLLAGSTALRAAGWADGVSQAERDAEHHPRSARSLYELGRVRLERAAASGDSSLHAAGLAALARAAELDPASPLPLAAMLRIALKDGDSAQPAPLIERVRRLADADARADVLEDVVRCQAYGPCPSAPPVVLALAATVLADAPPGSPAHRRAVEWLAIFYLRVLGDSTAGIRMLREIVAAAPRDLAVRARLAEALAASDGDVEARALAVAADLPWYTAFSQRPLWRRYQRLRALPPMPPRDRP